MLAQNTVVFITYHRVGNSTYPSTNVTQQQFEQQMDYLQQHHFHVWLPEKIIAYLHDGKVLPEHTVGIMFDDAYKSVYNNAWPVLQQHHFPFAIFVATEPSDKHYKAVLSWSQIKTLADSGVEIENHSVTHPHMATGDITEMRQEILQAQHRIEQMTGKKPSLFAYPYGEFSLPLIKVLQQLGFSAAFSQISGVVDEHSNFYRLPRFPLNEHYSNFKRFKSLFNLHALHVEQVKPEQIVLTKTPEQIQFVIASAKLAKNTFNCYYAKQTLVIDKHDWPLVRVDLQQPFHAGRNRINCTAQDAKNQWYWLGMLYLLH